ncbi:MAG: anaerobic ribonucleoside-triphosphate reductase activating protein [Bacilli bacterium]
MINGLRKLSLIDYPGKVSFVIFLGGCNFNCPFCHNKSIVEKNAEEYDEDTVLEMLKARKKLIDGVVITGGEPTIYRDKLISLIQKIKKLGYLVKLDTNGYNPSLLKKLLKEELLDYIAMDIKGTFSEYESIVRIPVNIGKIKESINLIENSNIEYEFRTTVYKEAHSEDDIKEIMSYVKDTSKLILQSYRYSKEQIEDIEYTSYSEEELIEIKNKYDLLVRV